MRTFIDLERELHLRTFTESQNGTLYFVPIAPGAPSWIVRRFDSDLRPSLVPVYVRLLEAAQAWIAADAELATLVRVEQPSEIGADFIAREHLLMTTLSAFLETDPEEDPPEPPPELAPMQARFRARAATASGPRDALLVEILGRSILERTSKTFHDEGAEQFVIADLKPTRDELEHWQGLASEH